MAANGLLGLFAVGVLGAGALILGMGGDDDEPQSNAYSPPPQKAPMLPAMTCEQALSQLKTIDPTLHAGVAMALAMSTDPVALRNLALKLQQAAGAPSLPDAVRPAVLKLAACVRDRAAAVEAAGGGLSKVGGVPNLQFNAGG